MVLGQNGASIYGDPSDPYTRADTFDLQLFLEGLATWLFWIIMMLAVIFILIAAFYFLTAGGDPNKIAMAKSTLIYALVGAVVAVLAWGLVTFIATFFGADASEGGGGGAFLELLGSIIT